MKKSLSTLLTFVLIIGIVSCSKDEKIDEFDTDEFTTITKIAFLDDSILNLKIGTSGTFKMRHEPEHLDIPKYSWHSSDINIVDINPYYGTYIAKRVGECIITAKTNIYTGFRYQELSAICKIVVSEIEIEDIEFDIKENYIAVGEEFTLTTYFTPNNTTNKSLEWSSSDSTIVNVDNKGNVYAKKEGECYIYAKTKNGKVAECKVVVSEIEIEDIKFDIEENYIAVGEEFTLTTYFTPNNATNKSLEWSSSDSTIVNVDNKGNVYAKKEGECYIYAKSQNGKVAKCKIVVQPVSIEVKFGSSAIISIMGYITGEIGFNLTNNSKHTITIKNLEIIDGYTKKTIFTTAFSNDNLSGKSNVSYSIRLNQVYKPIFKLNYIYNNKEYHTQKQYSI